MLPLRTKISYSLAHHALDANHGLPLTAKTDIGARRQAKAIIKAEGSRGAVLCFYCASDGCRGTIDI
jgi:hypothetical protein